VSLKGIHIESHVLKPALRKQKKLDTTAFSVFKQKELVKRKDRVEEIYYRISQIQSLQRNDNKRKQQKFRSVY
jgi:hypothetical protein